MSLILFSVLSAIMAVPIAQHNFKTGHTLKNTLAKTIMDCQSVCARLLLAACAVGPLPAAALGSRAAPAGGSPPSVSPLVRAGAESGGAPRQAW